MLSTSEDIPKSLSDPAIRNARMSLLSAPHIAPLTHYVGKLRRITNKEKLIPYFDPFDGGINAQCLFLFEAPGPKAVDTGFVSRNNPDESAKNFFLLNKEAQLPRSLTATWNIVPWYIGSGSRIRSATRNDIAEGLEHMAELIPLLGHLSTIVMGGRKAQAAEGYLRQHLPGIYLIKMPHTSPQFVNRAPGNRDRILDVLCEVRESLLGMKQDA